MILQASVLRLTARAVYFYHWSFDIFRNQGKMNGGCVQRLRLSSHGEEVSEQNNSGIDRKERQGDSQSMTQRRMLRSCYHSLKNSIAEEREEIFKADSDKFDSLIDKVKNLHNLVQKPREQVADAEALLDITSTFLESIKSTQNSNGISPVNFVNALLRKYSNQSHGNVSIERDDNQTHLSWGTLGLEASTIFCDVAGMSTMLGGTDSETKQRKISVSRKREKPTESTRPVMVADSGNDNTSETDKNIATMFNILRKHKRARLDALVLNRRSFSQTVENIFALSFLVKDGRVEINLDENKNHIVAPRNAPTANERASGQGSYSQFIFRFDYRDWKLMIESIEKGQELMPHRTCLPLYPNSENASAAPIRKNSRNRGREAPPAGGAQEASESDGGSSEKDFSQRPMVKRNKGHL